MLSWGASLSLGAMAALLPVAWADDNAVAIAQVMTRSVSAEMDFWPNASGPATSTWNASWTEQPWSTYIEETVAHGLGFHYYSASEPNNPNNKAGEPVFVGHTFVGNRVEWWGYWSYPGTEGSAQVNVTNEDGTQVLKTASGKTMSTGSKDPTMLADYTFPTVGNYTTRLYINWGTVAFTHVVSYMNMSSTQEDVDQARANPVDIVLADQLVATGTDPDGARPVSGFASDPQPLKILTEYGNGAWQLSNTIGKGGNGGIVPYPRVGTTDTNARLKLALGTGNLFVQLNGTMAYNHGVMQIDMDPAPPGRRAQEKYWGNTPWSVINATYYQTALDPTQNYTMTLTNLNSDGSDANYPWFEPATVRLWKSKSIGGSGGAKKSSNVGAIAGGVVGGVLGAALIGFAIWFFLRRRNKKHVNNVTGRRTPIDMIDEADFAGPAPTPYVAQPSEAMSMTATAAGPGTYATPTESGYTGRSSYDHYSVSGSSASGTALLTAGGAAAGGATAGGATAGGAAAGGRLSKGSRPPSGPVRRPQQASDAGTLHPLLPDPEDDMIPPSYNPEWETSSTASQARAGQLAPPQLPEGAHQRNSTLYHDQAHWRNS